MERKAIAIFGGAFDPIHFGHLRTALELYEALPIQELRFVPCKQPVHKAPSAATPEQRVDMLKLAITGQEGLTIDERELKRSTPSYMIETLESTRKQIGLTPLYLICSMDSFQKLHTWHRWMELLNLTHIIVATRAGFRLPRHAGLSELIKKHSICELSALNQQSVGFIYFQDTSLLEISSTKIRTILSKGLNPRYLLPCAVYEYIQQHKLYR